MANEIIARSAFLPTRAPSEFTSHDTVEQLLYVLFKRWRLIVGCVVTFAGAATIATVSRPTLYTAEAKILLKPDRVSIQISDLSPESAKTPYSAQALQSEIELIESRDVLRPVALRLLSGASAAPPQAPAASSDGAPAVAPVVVPDDDVIEAKERDLEGALMPSAVKDTSVIDLKYVSASASEAEHVLGMIVSQYLEHHALAYSGSAALLSFYEREKAAAAAKLAETENAYAAWQQANNVVAIDPRIDGLLKQQSDLEALLKQNRAATTMKLQSDPLLAKLKSDLMSAEVELGDLEQRYTDSDRRVREKAMHVTMVHGQKDAVEKAILGSVGAEQTALDRQIRDTAAALVDLRTKKLDGDRLSRDVAVARDAFFLYGKKLEEARISSNLDRAQLSNVAIIEQPHATDQTNADERTGLVILAAIVGVTLALVSALFLEFFNKALRTRRDVETYLGVPVLAAIPDLRTRALPSVPRPAIA
jgi:uncharacterized protein involved in exopolysaccharide biosynthesis